MTLIRFDPKTGQIAQFIPQKASYVTGKAVPDSEVWITVYFQEGSGITMRILEEAEAKTWILALLHPAGIGR